MTRTTPRLPIIETQRLRLEPLTPADAGALFPLLNDPSLVAHRETPEIDDPALVAEMVEGQLAEMGRGRAVHWAIRALGEGDFLGCCDLSHVDRRGRRAEVGFLLAGGAWGRGYGLEALRSVVAHAAGSGVRRLASRAQLGDRRAEALLEKLGFEEQGLVRGQVMRDGERRDLRLFGLTL